MEKIILCAVVLLLCLSVSSCAQTRNVAIRSSGFFVIPGAGTIMADENGQPLEPKRDTVITLFVETKEPSVQWVSAWQRNRSFSLMQQPVIKTVVVGESKSNGHKIELSPSNGNTLWQLELSNDEQKTRAPRTISDNEVLLKGLFNGRPFFVRIPALTELASPLYQ